MLKGSLLRLIVKRFGEVLPSIIKLHAYERRFQNKNCSNSRNPFVPGTHTGVYSVPINPSFKTRVTILKLLQASSCLKCVPAAISIEVDISEVPGCQFSV